MDDLGASLSGGELAVVLAWIVFATVLGIQKAKALVAHKRPEWAARSWPWVLASAVVPAVLVAIVCQRWAQNLINPMLPEAVRLDIPPDATLPTTFTAIMGANGAYAVAKKLGLTKSYSDPGPGSGPQVAADRVPEEPVTDLKPPSLAVAPGPGLGAEPPAEAEPITARPAADRVPEEPEELRAYLLNFCDTDPAVGPHVVLVDGRLYRVEHGRVEHLPLGWQRPSEEKA